MLSIPPAADTDTIDSVRCTLSLLLHLAAFCPGIEEWRGRESARGAALRGRALRAERARGRKRLRKAGGIRD